MIRRCARLLFAALLIGALPAHGADDAQLRQLRLQVRQAMQAARDAQQAATEAQTRSQDLGAERDRLAGSLDAVEQVRAQLDGEVARLRRETTALETRVGELEQALASEQAAHRDARRALEETSGRLTMAVKTNGQLLAAYRSCHAHNGELARAAAALLDAYEGKGVLSVLGEHEPFTGIGRVRLENLMETYRDQIDAATLAPLTVIGPQTDPGGTRMEGGARARRALRIKASSKADAQAVEASTRP